MACLHPTFLAHTHCKKTASPLLSWCVSMATLTSCCDRQSGLVAMVSRCDIKPELQLPWHHTYWLSSYFCVMSGANRQRSYNVPFSFVMHIPLFCCRFMCSLCNFIGFRLWLCDVERLLSIIFCKIAFEWFSSLSLFAQSKVNSNYYSKSFWWRSLFCEIDV